ncbi:hypothetical protein GUJ93_ZPchr0272g29197 [Zizania palustris]|uniref:Uncharacterized protein n=1 Tax=Zizania palustris TaxID=103762 RepID=A0A8J5RCD0_ZIZPA|nr:hypothetical protein GUJ93_ZPchr0272g29197 [Zizania palustris]
MERGKGRSMRSAPISLQKCPLIFKVFTCKCHHLNPIPSGKALALAAATREPHQRQQWRRGTHPQATALPLLDMDSNVPSPSVKLPADSADWNDYNTRLVCEIFFRSSNCW